MVKALYWDFGKTDREIAQFLEIDRTSVVHFRKRNGIPSRISTGEIGELLAADKLQELGFLVYNMNEADRLHPFDLLVDKEIEVEVKSSMIGENERFNFILSEKPENQNIISDDRIRLKNGRTKKLYRKTCDFIMFVGIRPEKDPVFYLMPSNVIPDELGTISIGTKTSKYSAYKSAWHLLKPIKEA